MHGFMWLRLTTGLFLTINTVLGIAILRRQTMGQEPDLTLTVNPITPGGWAYLCSKLPRRS